MKKLIVKAQEIAISYKNGDIRNVYVAGEYRIGYFEDVTIYQRGTMYQAPIHMDIALQNKDLCTVVDIVDVKEAEIVAMFYNGILQSILKTGQHVFFRNVVDYTYQLIDLSQYRISETIDATLINHKLMAPYLRTFTVEAYQKGILFVDGKFTNIVEPGQYNFFINPIMLHIAKVDTRTMAMDLSGQEILSKDKAQLRMNFTLQYKVVDILKYMVENKEAEKQLYTAAQLAMRTIVGRLSIDELLEDKDHLNTQLLENTKEAAAALGVQVFSCGIKDIILPADIKNILHQVLIAEKKAQANIVTRREETASTRSLLNTAKLMEENAMLFKLKEMEYVEKIAEKINTISLSGNGQIVDQLKTIFVK